MQPNKIQWAIIWGTVILASELWIDPWDWVYYERDQFKSAVICCVVGGLLTWQCADGQIFERVARTLSAGRQRFSFPQKTRSPLPPSSPKPKKKRGFWAMPSDDDGWLVFMGRLVFWIVAVFGFQVVWALIVSGRPWSRAWHLLERSLR